jgi:hypothetical protein
VFKAEPAEIVPVGGGAANRHLTALRYNDTGRPEDQVQSAVIFYADQITAFAKLKRHVETFDARA